MNFSKILCSQLSAHCTSLLSDGIPTDALRSYNPCKTYDLGKQQQLPFPEVSFYMRSTIHDNNHMNRIAYHLVVESTPDWHGYKSNFDAGLQGMMHWTKDSANND